MDKNEYLRKKLGECKDHAADGKKEFKISAVHKKDVVIGDMGRAAMDEADLETGTILLTILYHFDQRFTIFRKFSTEKTDKFCFDLRRFFHTSKKCRCHPSLNLWSKWYSTGH